MLGAGCAGSVSTLRYWECESCEERCVQHQFQRKMTRGGAALRGDQRGPEGMRLQVHGPIKPSEEGLKGSFFEHWGARSGLTSPSLLCPLLRASHPHCLFVMSSDWFRSWSHVLFTVERGIKKLKKNWEKRRQANQTRKKSQIQERQLVALGVKKVRYSWSCAPPIWLGAVISFEALNSERIRWERERRWASVV